ncbi:MAG TPA: 2-C-methyl-D-erythritol 2,4-cyclodiphosphate synthase [Acidimicrobiales bacterium]|nr:2-C-methyl-D-erythritol 2,4-cyclodiphosphate synthase [Acidimicrobiales bacterium]
MNLRVGQGFDIHPFSPDPARPLLLAGVRVDGPGLQGHSDGDVVCHAIADALLGAAGLGDIGTAFPDTDERWRGADSVHLLTTVRARIEEPWHVLNADCTIIAEAPRLGPYKELMAGRMAAVLRAPVSVKAKRGEGLGALGRHEGIACLAVVLLATA